VDSTPKSTSFQEWTQEGDFSGRVSTKIEKKRNHFFLGFCFSGVKEAGWVAVPRAIRKQLKLAVLFFILVPYHPYTEAFASSQTHKQQQQQQPTTNNNCWGGGGCDLAGLLCCFFSPQGQRSESVTSCFAFHWPQRRGRWWWHHKLQRWSPPPAAGGPS